MAESAFCQCTGPIPMGYSWDDGMGMPVHYRPGKHGENTCGKPSAAYVENTFRAMETELGQTTEPTATHHTEGESSCLTGPTS